MHFSSNQNNVPNTKPRQQATRPEARSAPECIKHSELRAANIADATIQRYYRYPDVNQNNVSKNGLYKCSNI